MIMHILARLDVLLFWAFSQVNLFVKSMCYKENLLEIEIKRSVYLSAYRNTKISGNTRSAVTHDVIIYLSM